MAIEAKRGCGYRKVGGLYLCGDNRNMHDCCLMPILLHVCPTCNGGVKQTRSWQWIDPKPWLAKDCIRRPYSCALAGHGQGLGDKVGLIWIGAEHYPTPDDFQREAARLGISRRIKAVPRGFELGKHWVWFAHPKVSRDVALDKWIGGVFRIFKPTRIEKIITESEARDPEIMDDLNARDICAVVVPDNDPDHAAPRKTKPKSHLQLALDMDTTRHG